VFHTIVRVVHVNITNKPPIEKLSKGNMVSEKPPGGPLSLVDWIRCGCGDLCLILRILDLSVVWVSYYILVFLL
jgi:hypothetical protein